MSALELTYQQFITRITDAGRKVLLFRLMRQGFIMLISFVLLALLILSLEAIFEFSTIVRKILLFGYISAFAATIVTLAFLYYSLFKKLNTQRSITGYAKRIGSQFPEVKDNLINAIQIFDYTKKNDTVFSSSLATEGINQVDKNTRGINFTNIVSYKKNNPVIVLFTFAFLLFTSLLLIFPNVFQAAGNRLINYNYTFVENTLGIAYEVTPGNIEISKGDKVDITSKILFNDKNYTTDKITFNTREISSEGVELSSNSEKVNSVSTNEFKTSLASVNSVTQYWFEYKGIKSSIYTINISSRPLIKTTKITVYPPAYTKLPSRTIDGNEISTIAGSRIYVEIEASDELSRSFVDFNGGNKINMEINGKTAVANLTASSNGIFKVNIIKDQNGKELINLNPQEYQVRVYPDEYPKINIVEPTSELTLQNAKDVVIRSRVSDDFGFTKMRLGYRTSKTKYGAVDKDFRFTEIAVQNKDATGLEVPYVWNLASLNPGTEDEFEYFIEIYDNDAIAGPKMSRSNIQKIVIPSLESLLKKTEQTKEDIETSMKNAMEDAMELKKNLEEIKDQLKNNPEEMGLNDPKKMEELKNKIENIQNQLSTTQQKLDNMMNDLKNNNQISKETLDKYMEIQKLFQQIDSKELREALQKLQEAMKNMNKDELQEAMKNFKFDEENFKKAMEKTMELLKKIMNEQKFGELTQKLDEIAKKQEETKNETQKTNENNKDKMNELSKTQDEIKKQYEEFQKQLQQLKDNMKQLKNDDIAKQMEKMLNEMMKKQLEQKMNQSSQDLQKQQKKQSQQKQEDISQDLNDMNQNMQDMLQQMIDQENSKAMQKMEENLDKLKKMSKEQQRLKEQSKELDKDSENKEFQKNQQEQNNLKQQLSETIEELMMLQQQMGNNPMLNKNLGDAFNEMDKASEQLGKKEGKNANKSQGNAKESLDKAIEKLSQMCENGKNPGKGKKPGSGMQQLLQQLQQMIAQQQQMNNQMGNMGLNGNQGQLTQEQMAQMQKLSMQQEAIKKNLEQLNEDVKKQQETDGKKMLGDLDQVQKDMQEVIKDLQDNNVTPETKKRQEKILSRMLDFQLSTREKDFEQKRESRPGKNFDRSSPPEIVISRPNIIDGINQDALEMQKESYMDDYELMIQKYRAKVKENK